MVVLEMKINRLILMVLLVFLILMPTASAFSFWMSQSEIKSCMNDLDNNDVRMTFINNVMRQQNIDAIEIITTYGDTYYFVKSDSRATIEDTYSESGNIWILMPGIFEIEDLLEILFTDSISFGTMTSALGLYVSMDMVNVPSMQTIIINFVYN